MSLYIDKLTLVSHQHKHQQSRTFVVLHLRDETRVRYSRLNFNESLVIITMSVDQREVNQKKKQEAQDFLRKSEYVYAPFDPRFPNQNQTK